MFTGIIESTGKLAQATRHHLFIEAPTSITGDLKEGGSIAVDGACLTCTKVSREGFEAEVMPETLAKTNLGFKNPGDRLNLERPLPASGRLEGHIVTGHIEGVGEIKKIVEDGNAHLLSVQLPDRLMKYVVPKGSIALNGISLTVIDVTDNEFTVAIIPHTWELTNLRDLSVGDKVNIEMDLIAKYVEKILCQS